MTGDTWAVSTCKKLHRGGVFSSDGAALVKAFQAAVASAASDVDLTCVAVGCVVIHVSEAIACAIVAACGERNIVTTTWDVAAEMAARLVSKAPWVQP
jgi:hypothetical protein